MTTSIREFDDLADKKFVVPTNLRPHEFGSCLLFESKTYAFHARAINAGLLTNGDLDGKSVVDLLRLVPTTRGNFERVLAHFRDVGIVLQ